MDERTGPNNCTGPNWYSGMDGRTAVRNWSGPVRGPDFWSEILFGPVRGPDFGPEFFLVRYVVRILVRNFCWSGTWSGFLVRIFFSVVRGPDFGPKIRSGADNPDRSVFWSGFSRF